MSRVRDLRERVHQPFYDSLTRGMGKSSVTNLTALFGNSNVGNRALTNMLVAGQLSADSTYLLKAMRAVLWFQSINDTEFNAAYGGMTALANATSSQSRAQDMYSLLSYGASFTLTVGTKPLLNGPLWYLPAGGGPFGSSTENSRHVITNGVPSQQSILKLAKDVPIFARQNFNVQVEFFSFLRLGEAQSGAIGADYDPLAALNAFDGFKLVQIHIDGVHTRDVQ